MIVFADGFLVGAALMLFLIIALDWRDESGEGDG